MTGEIQLSVPRRRTPQILWVLWGAFVLAIVVFAVTRGGPIYRDENDYLEIANNIASGNGYLQFGRATATRPPVWPMIIALFLFLGAPSTAIALLSAACLAGASVMAKYVAEWIGGPAAGWVTAFAVLCYPLNVYTAATLYPQALAAFLIMAMVAIVLRARPGLLLFSLVGLGSALLILSVPTMAFTSFVLLLWSLWHHRTHWRIFAIVACVGLLVPVSLWAIRNYVVLGDVIPVSSVTGTNLLLGNNPDATPSSGVGVDISEYRAQADGMSETQADDFYGIEAKRWIMENPSQAFELYLGKVLNYFSPYNDPQTAEAAGDSFAKIVAWATFAPVFLLAALRATLVRRISWTALESAMWTAFIGNAFFMAVAFTRTRFRMPLDCFLLIEAAIFVVVVVGAIRTPRLGGARQ